MVNEEIVRFAKLVKLMRSTQREFSRDRRPALLTMARELEGRVDRAVDWIMAHRLNHRELFPGDEPEPGDPPAASPRGGPYGADDYPAGGRRPRRGGSRQ